MIPTGANAEGAAAALYSLDDYLAEVRVGEGCVLIDRKIRELDDEAEDLDVAIAGLVRNGKRLPGRARSETIRAGDLIVIEANAKSIDAFVGAFKLEYVGSEKHKDITSEGLSLAEAVVPENSRIEGRSALSLKLLYRHGVTLLGVSRRGKSFRDRVRKLDTQAGDALLLLGPTERLNDVISWLGCLPLQERNLQVIQRNKAWIAVASFLVAIGLATSGLITGYSIDV